MVSAQLQSFFRGAVLISLLFALLSCLLHYKSLDKGARIFALYILISFLDEGLAFLAGLIFRNNNPVFFVYGIIEILMISLFFNEVIDIFKRKNIGIYIGITGAILGLIDGKIQSIMVINHYFLFLESIVIVSMSLFFFARLMITQASNQLVYYNLHFLIAALLTFFWTSNLFTWGLQYYNVQPNSVYQVESYYMIECTNVVYYAGVGIVYLLYPKLRLKACA